MDKLKTPPRARRAHKMRQTIINTALDILNNEGLEKLSLREIARRIDYTPAALYEYFDSKEALLQALVLEADRQLTQMMRTAIQDCPVDQKLLKAGMTYIQFAESNPQLYQLFVNAPAPQFTSAAPAEEECGGNSYRLLAEILHEAYQQHVFKQPAELSLEEINFACWALVHGIASLQHLAMQGIFEAPDAVQQKILNLFINNLINSKA